MKILLGAFKLHNVHKILIELGWVFFIKLQNYIVDLSVDRHSLLRSYWDIIIVYFIIIFLQAELLNSCLYLGTLFLLQFESEFYLGF